MRTRPLVVLDREDRRLPWLSFSIWFALRIGAVTFCHGHNVPMDVASVRWMLAHIMRCGSDSTPLHQLMRRAARSLGTFVGSARQAPQDPCPAFAPCRSRGPARRAVARATHYPLPTAASSVRVRPHVDVLRLWYSLLFAVAARNASEESE